MPSNLDSPSKWAGQPINLEKLELKLLQLHQGNKDRAGFSGKHQEPVSGSQSRPTDRGWDSRVLQAFTFLQVQDRWSPPEECVFVCDVCPVCRHLVGCSSSPCDQVGGYQIQTQSGASKHQHMAPLLPITTGNQWLIFLLFWRWYPHRGPVKFW